MSTHSVLGQPHGRFYTRAPSARAADRLDSLVVALTLGRLLLIPLVIACLTSWPRFTALPLLAFILVDVYDGVLARKRGSDTPARRALDSIADRIAIHAVFLAAVLLSLVPIVFWVLLLARDGYCAYWCYRIMNERWCAIRADWLYRTLNLSLAAWIVLSPLAPDSVVDLFAIAVLALAGVVAFDLTRSSRRLLAMAWLSSEVVSATRLRSGHDVV